MEKIEITLSDTKKVQILEEWIRKEYALFPDEFKLNESYPALGQFTFVKGTQDDTADNSWY